MNRAERRAARRASSGAAAAPLAVMDAPAKPDPGAAAAAAFDLGESAVAMDAFRNLAARMGYGSAAVSEGVDYQLIRWSNDYWLMITLFRNHWIARRIVEAPAQDMTRAWPKLTCELTPEGINDFDRVLMKTMVKSRIQAGLTWGDLFGGAGCLIVIDGHEDILDKPLNLDDVNPGTFKGLITFDRWAGITPSTDICTDINRPQDFGYPESYTVRGDSDSSFEVHSSRILRFTGPMVPTPEFQACMRWGISRLEIVYEELKKRDNASWSILQLMFRAQVLAQTNPELASLLSGASMAGGGAGAGPGASALMQFQMRMQAQNELLSNQSMLILGKEGKLESTQFAFSGLADVYQQFQLDIAGAAEMPVSRLFGRTISGLGQSNDADEKIYEERIAQAQNEKLRPALDKLYPVICMSVFGEVPDDLDYKFPSVRVLTEKEKAELAKDVGAVILDAFTAGVISQKQALMELAALGDSTGVFTNITKEDIAKANDDATPQGMGDMPDPDEPEAGGEAAAEEGGKKKPAAAKDAAEVLQWIRDRVARRRAA